MTPTEALAAAVAQTRDLWLVADRDSWSLAEPEGMAADILAALSQSGWSLVRTEGLEAAGIQSSGGGRPAQPGTERTSGVRPTAVRARTSASAPCQPCQPDGDHFHGHHRHDGDPRYRPGRECPEVHP